MGLGLSTLLLARGGESACDRKEPRRERHLRLVDASLNQQLDLSGGENGKSSLRGRPAGRRWPAHSADEDVSWCMHGFTRRVINVALR